jgi:hypothetical protein
MRAHVFRIVLLSAGYYDDSEVFHQPEIGNLTHVGTADSAIAFTKQSNTSAMDARIERIAAICDGGKRIPFQAHEIQTFTIGL